MKIRKAIGTDKSEILNIHKKAFGEQKGLEIRQLVDSLLEDITAKPCFSFVAVQDEMVVGHVLFTKVTINGTSEGLSAQILAPLAVLPDNQYEGVGSQLIKTGIEGLKKSGVKLVGGHRGRP